MIQAVGEDGVDDLHHNGHDVNEVGRLGAQRRSVNDAVHLVYGMGVSGGLTVAGGVSGGPDCNVIAEQGGGPALGLHGPEVAHLWSIGSEFSSAMTQHRQHFINIVNEVKAQQRPPARCIWKILRCSRCEKFPQIDCSWKTI